MADEVVHQSAVSEGVSGAVSEGVSSAVSEGVSSAVSEGASGAVSEGASGSVATRAVVYTDEQNAIINESVSGDARIVSVNALPGSGKTKLLEAIAEKSGDKRVLYLVFNEHNQKEAAERLTGENVKIESFNKLAYRATLGAQRPGTPGSEKQVVSDDNEKPFLFEELIESLSKDFDPKNKFSSPEDQAEIVLKFMNMTNLSEDRVNELLNNPLLGYLEATHGISSLRKQFTRQNLYDNTGHPYTDMCLEKYANERNNKTVVSAEIGLYASLVSIVESTLEKGWLEVDALYAEKTTAFRRAKPWVFEILNIDSVNNSKIQNKQLDTLAGSIITGMCNQMIAEQLDMSKTTGLFHSAYLAKYGQSNAPYQLGKFYDHILLDEAQDTNQACWNVIRGMMYGNKELKLTMVGDNHQSIYSFRHARNVLEETPVNTIDPLDEKAFKRLALTKVFRIGGEVVDLANSILTLRHYELKTISTNKMKFERTEKNIQYEPEALESPLYLCDPHDKDRGKIVSGAVGKRVIKAFKDAPGTRPAIICSRNMGYDGTPIGVLGELGTDLTQGRSVTLPVGGAAYEAVERLSLMARLHTGQYSDLPEELAKKHKTAIDVAVRVLGKSIHDNPGYLLGKAHCKAETGRELIEQEIKDYLSLKVDDERITTTLALYHPDARKKSTAAGKAIFERAILAAAGDRLTAQTFGGNLDIRGEVKEAIDLLYPSDDADDKKPNYEMRNTEREISSLAQTYAKLIGASLAVSEHENNPEQLSTISKLSNAAITNLTQEHGMTALANLEKEMGPRQRLMNRLSMDLEQLEDDLFNKPESVFSCALLYGRVSMGDDFTHHSAGQRGVRDILVRSPVLDVAYQYNIGTHELMAGLLVFNSGAMNLKKFISDIRLPTLEMDCESADVIVGTAHKTKGLEYEYVGLSGDIIPPSDRMSSLQCAEQWNATLIACTRAKQGLVLSTPVEAAIATMAGGNPIASKIAAEAAETLLASMESLGSNTNLTGFDGSRESTLDYYENQRQLGQKIGNNDKDKLRALLGNVADADVTSETTNEFLRGVRMDIQNMPSTMAKAKQELLQTVDQSSKALHILNCAQENIADKVISVVNNDILESVTTTQLETRIVSSISSKLGGDAKYAAIRKIIPLVNNDMKARSYGSAGSKPTATTAAVYSGTTNIDFKALFTGKMDVDRYLDKRDLPVPIPGMDGDIARGLYSAALEGARGLMPDKSFKLASKSAVLLQKKLVVDAVSAHLVTTTVKSMEALKANNFDYNEAFKQQIAGTRKSPDAFNNLTKTEQKQALSSATRLTERQKRIYQLEKERREATQSNQPQQAVAR